MEQNISTEHPEIFFVSCIYNHVLLFKRLADSDASSGSSMDWVQLNLNPDFVFGIEMRPTTKQGKVKWGEMS